MPDIAVMDEEVREIPHDERKRFQSYGVYGDSLNLMKESWKGMDFRFTVRSTAVRRDEGQGVHSFRGPRPSAKKVAELEVDVLVVERGGCRGQQQPRPTKTWERLIETQPSDKRPKLIVETWPAQSTLWKPDTSPNGKDCRSRWKALGYETRSKIIDSKHLDGAIEQSLLLVVRDSTDKWKWAPYDGTRGSRPMGNLLTPPGLLRLTARERQIRRDNVYPEGALRNYARDPMPLATRLIEDAAGPRNLRPEEILRGLGMEKQDAEWGAKESMDVIRNTTSVFHWEYLSQCFLLMGSVPPEKRNWENDDDETAYSTDDDPYDSDQDDDQPWPGWIPPDMSPGSSWTRTRVDNLVRASKYYPDPEEIVRQGMQDLEIHRGNYDRSGPAPKELQLLWWEFPYEHWEEVRLGGSMNFLCEPKHGLQENAPMTHDRGGAQGSGGVCRRAHHAQSLA